MRYTVERNFVRVLGRIWLPDCIGATEYPICVPRDLEIIEHFTRENVERWLATRAGDFREVLDFYATVGSKEIPWNSEENEHMYDHCMYGSPKEP